MIRESKRPLTGPASSWSCYAGHDTNEPEVKLGRRPGKPGDTEMRFTYVSRGERIPSIVPAAHRGQPAVTVDLNASRSGARTFENAAELTALAAELTEAAEWLTTEQMFGEQS